MGLNNEKKKRNSHEKHIIHHTFARSRLSFFAVIATESRSLESLIFTKGNPKRDAPKIEEEIKVKNRTLNECFLRLSFYFSDSD